MSPTPKRRRRRDGDQRTDVAGARTEGFHSGPRSPCISTQAQAAKPAGRFAQMLQSKHERTGRRTLVHMLGFRVRLTVLAAR